MTSLSYLAPVPLQDPTAGKTSSVAAAAGAGAEEDVERTVGLLNWGEDGRISAAAAAAAHVAGDVGVEVVVLGGEAFEFGSC